MSGSEVALHIQRVSRYFINRVELGGGVAAALHIQRNSQYFINRVELGVAAALHIQRDSQYFISGVEVQPHFIYNGLVHILSKEWRCDVTSYTMG